MTVNVDIKLSADTQQAVNNIARLKQETTSLRNEASQTSLKEAFLLGDATLKDVQAINTSLERTRGQLTAIGQSSLGRILGDDLRLAGAQLDNAEGQARRLAQTIDRLTDELNDVNRSRPLAEIEDDLARARTEAIALTRAVNDIPKELRESGIANRTGFLGDIETSGRTVTGAVGAFGGAFNIEELQQFEQFANLGTEVFAVAEAIPRLTGALQILRAGSATATAAQATQATTASTLAATSTAASGGMTTLIGTMTPLVAGVALLGASFYIASQNAKDLREQTEEFGKQIEQRLEVERAIFEAQRASDPTQSLASAQAQLESVVFEINQIPNAFEAARENAIALNETSGFVDRIAASVGGLANQEGSYKDQITKNLTAMQERYDELSRERQILEASIEVLRARAAEEERYNAAVAAGQEQASAAIDRATSEAERERQIRQDIASLSTEQARERLATLQAEQDANRDAAEAIRQQIADNRAILSDFMDGNLDLADQAAVAEQANRELIQALRDLNTEYVNNNQAIQDVRDIVLPAVSANERHAAALEGTVEATEAAADAEDGLQARRERAVSELAQVNSRLEDISTSRAEAAAEQSRRDALASDQARRLAALDSQLEQARQVRAVQQRNQALIEARNSAVEREREILKEGNADLADIQRDYQKDAQREAEDWARERLRIEQDLNQDLSDAVLNNDVTAFIRAQRDGLQRLTRGDQDFATGQARDREDAQAEAAARAAAIEEQRVAIIAEAQERRNAIIQGEQETTDAVAVLERQKQLLQQRFAQENAALTEQINREKTEQEINDLRTRRQLLQNEIITTNQSFVNAAFAAARNTGVAAVQGYAAAAQSINNSRNLSVSFAGAQFGSNLGQRDLQEWGANIVNGIAQRFSGF